LKSRGKEFRWRTTRPSGVSSGEIVPEKVVFPQKLGLCSRNQDRCRCKYRQLAEQLVSKESLNLAISFFGRHRNLRPRSAPGNNRPSLVSVNGLGGILSFLGVFRKMQKMRRVMSFRPGDAYQSSTKGRPTWKRRLILELIPEKLDEVPNF
jgi:hypothetical protein